MNKIIFTFLLTLMTITAYGLELEIELKKLDNEFELNNQISLTEYNKSLLENKKVLTNKLLELQKTLMDSGNAEGVVLINEKIKNLDVSKNDLIDSITIDLANSIDRKIGRWIIDKNRYNGLMYNLDERGEIMYSVNLPTDGFWNLEIEYASLEVRPVNIQIESFKFDSCLYRKTGSFDGTKTTKETFKLTLKRGLRVLKLSHSNNPCPHIKSIIFKKG